MSERDDPTSTYFRFFNEIGIIAQLSGNRLERVLPEGMSLAQFSVLNHFCRLGGAWSPTRLAAAFQVTKGAMTNTLQRLEAQGFVTVRPDDDDARAKLVEITDAGRRAREDGVHATGVIVAELADLVPLSDVKTALPLLEFVRKTLDENR
jgi:DNA-binding MarR family transcriptional regulator